ncbi:MAG: hypothetical protein K2X87_01860 [Gemmataceae bacterium]|nr:hypothetical protein [Gemmataceae bacterium]
MKVIALIDLSAGKTMADLAPHREAETRALWELVKAGRVRAAHYRETMTGAVLELEAASTAEAHGWLGDLPAVKAGVLTVSEAVGLLPYSGYELLFATK